MGLFVGVVLFAGIAILAFGRVNIDGKSAPPKTHEKPSRRTVQQGSLKAGTAQTSRFDVHSSTHLRQTRILTGAAYITDGDTIKIKGTQVRLFGIDAPEISHPYGQKAKWALHKMCKGHLVRAEITEQDKFGRTVAQCYLPDGRDLSAEMVKQGLAIDWAKFSGGIYLDLEQPDARKKLFLADARQKGRMHVWEKFEANNRNK